MRKPAAAKTPSSDIDFADPSWAAAIARLRLYVQALDLPAAEAEALIHAALEQAHARDPAEPLATAMDALQALLAQREPIVAGATWSMPELHRAPMVPEPLNRSPLHFFLHELVQPAVLGALRFLTGGLRHQRLLLVITVVGAGALFQILR